MKFNGQIDVAVGMSANTRKWKNTKMQWSAFAAKLQEENRTNETFKEFMAASKADQTKIKDVGGYVGGYIREGKRSPRNILHRQVLTLDIDFAHLELWDDICMLFDNAAVLHGTHKHSARTPRYRLIMPLSREATPDEYVAVARKISGTIGIDLFDNTTFETNRLMFWPSNPKDVEYYCETQDGPWIDVDKVLSEYVDWKDTSAWPTADSKYDGIKNESQKQEDPETKKGTIGAFCRTYTITEVMEKFLKDEYEPTTLDDRFTYSKGTAAGGLIVYDDKFAYSHHGTDPCSGKLCNAFDFVRLHKFGHLDSDATTGKPKSFGLMEDFCRKDKETKKTIAQESMASAKYEFAEPLEVSNEDVKEEESIEWLTELELDAKNNYAATASNLNAIFANDPRLKQAFKENVFDNKNYVFKSLPWRKITKPEPIKNVDYSGLRNYIESVYGIVGNLKIEDTLILEFEKQKFHPIKDYLNAQVWDKKPRLNKLLVDYFGAADNVYSHEAIRKPLVGAVARVFQPGVKFDLVLTLVGAQGTGKSTFLKKLGQGWFSDTFMTVQGKEALEQIQGSWLIEMAELAGLRKAEVEATKHFITKQEDTFRPAYGRTTETYLRQCVFFGTTNNKDFLRDPSGNRRFMPVDIDPDMVSKNVWEELELEVGQIWAEALHLYKQGEKLYLSEEAELIAKKEQFKHSETDERKGIIEMYLNRALPKDWGEKDILDRREFIESPKTGEIQREYVCMAEIWCECLCKDRNDMSRYNTREVNNVVKSLPNWELHNSTRKFPLYGTQKFYSRIKE